MASVESNGGTVPRRVVGRPFPKGVSGNPGGRKKGLAAAARERIGANGEEALDFLKGVMNDPQAKTSDRLEAARLLLDRGFGKAPATTVSVEADERSADQLEAGELAARAREILARFERADGLPASA